MKKFNKAIAKIVFNVAKKASGEASQWFTYQPKEPLVLKTIKK